MVGAHAPSWPSAQSTYGRLRRLPEFTDLANCCYIYIDEGTAGEGKPHPYNSFRREIILRLLLMRHGSTLDNEQQRYSGQADVPLSAPGESQVALLGQQFAHEAIDLIVTSDLQRARATGAAIAHYHHAPVYEDPAIREISLGAWEGLTFAELRERDPEVEMGISVVGLKANRLGEFRRGIIGASQSAQN